MMAKVNIMLVVIVEVTTRIKYCCLVATSAMSISFLCDTWLPSIFETHTLLFILESEEYICLDLTFSFPFFYLIWRCIRHTYYSVRTLNSDALKEKKIRFRNKNVHLMLFLFWVRETQNTTGGWMSSSTWLAGRTWFCSSLQFNMSSNIVLSSFKCP